MMRELKEGQALYAIGMGDWIELRKHSRPPRMEVTTALQKLTRPSTYDLYQHRWTPTQKDMTLKCTIYVGGRVIHHMKAATFKRKAGFGVRKDELKEVPASVVKRVLSTRGN
jgi:hypothetical protein